MEARRRREVLRVRVSFVRSRERAHAPARSVVGRLCASVTASSYERVVAQDRGRIVLRQLPERGGRAGESRADRRARSCRAGAARRRARSRSSCRRRTRPRASRAARAAASTAPFGSPSCARQPRGVPARIVAQSALADSRAGCDRRARARAAVRELVLVEVGERPHEVVGDSASRRAASRASRSASASARASRGGRRSSERRAAHRRRPARRDSRSTTRHSAVQRRDVLSAARAAARPRAYSARSTRSRGSSAARAGHREVGVDRLGPAPRALEHLAPRRAAHRERAVVARRARLAAARIRLRRAIGRERAVVVRRPRRALGRRELAAASPAPSSRERRKTRARRARGSQRRGRSRDDPLGARATHASAIDVEVGDRAHPRRRHRRRAARRRSRARSTKPARVERHLGADPTSRCWSGRSRGRVERPARRAAPRRARARSRDPRRAARGDARARTGPPAARMPACRMPPPCILRRRCARRDERCEPATSEPTGAPRPFDRHTRHGVERRRQLALGRAGRRGRVPQPRAVEVQRHAERVRRLGDRRDCVRLAARCRPPSGCACSRPRRRGSAASADRRA